MCLLYSHTSALAREAFYVGAGPQQMMTMRRRGGGKDKEERKEANRCECPGRKGLLRLEGTLQLTLSYDCLCLGVEWTGQGSWTYSFLFFNTITNYLNLKVSLCGFTD